MRAYRKFGIMALLILSLGWQRTATAQTVSWDDGALFNSLWSSFLNWDHNASPAGNDITIGDLAAAMGDTTLIDDTYAVNSLTIMNGAEVINSPDGGTTDFELQVNGLTSIQSGGRFTMYGGAADALDTEQLEIVDGTVTLDSSQPAGLARLEIESSAASSLDIQSNGTLIGNGRVDLEGSPVNATRLLRQQRNANSRLHRATAGRRATLHAANHGHQRQRADRPRWYGRRKRRGECQQKCHARPGRRIE